MVDAHLPKLAGTEIRSDDASLSSVLPTPSSAHELSSPWVPGSSGVDHDGPAHESSNPTASFPGCAVSQPFPLPDLPQQQPPPPTPPSNLQQHQDLPSPLKEPQPDLTTLLNPAFTVDLPSALDLPSPPLAKVQHNLRLPSFDLLGIAAPHPDHISGRPPTASAWELGSGPLSKPGDPLHALSPVPYRFRTLGEVEPSAMPSPEQAKPHVEHLIPTITPPEEPGTFHWGAFVNIRTAGMGSPPTSEPGAPPLTATSNQEFASGGLSDPAPATSPGPISGAPAWLDKAENIITETFSDFQSDVVKVLSHALPCPSRAGHVFPTIIDAIHRQTPNHSTAWINVFHAVPGRFNLADLPTSPPTTPGPVVGGEEYFTSKVFDSAVAVSEYQGDSKLMPPSPRPVVPPASVDVSIVERYIPPTNHHEFIEMFNIKGRSLLVDRVVELSPRQGTLLFIYPTRTGGRTFMREYLGPILDPFLRSLAVVHNLSADFCRSLGDMVSVERLLEFDVLNAALERFCEQVGDSSYGKYKYSIVHSSKEEVILDRDVWAKDWWIKQEKQRIRTAVAKHSRPTQKASKPATDAEAAPSNLIQEILDSVATKSYEHYGPKTGVEVGVFIIRKTA